MDDRTNKGNPKDTKSRTNSKVSMHIVLSSDDEESQYVDDLVKEEKSICKKSKADRDDPDLASDLKNMGKLICTRSKTNRLSSS